MKLKILVRALEKVPQQICETEYCLLLTVSVSMKVSFPTTTILNIDLVADVTRCQKLGSLKC